MPFNLEVSFPGGKRVDVQMDDVLVRTDQSVKHGGEGSAPDPFTLFLSSIAACAGVYALSFCQARNISTQGLGLSLSSDYDEKTKLCGRMVLTLALPKEFPEKYREAIVRAMDQCTVKRNLLNPPQIEIQVQPA